MKMVLALSVVEILKQLSMLCGIAGILNPCGSSRDCDGLIINFGQMSYMSGLNQMEERGAAMIPTFLLGEQPSYLLSGAYGRVGTGWCLMEKLD